jgi:hypothetical protein
VPPPSASASRARRRNGEAVFRVAANHHDVVEALIEAALARRHLSDGTLVLYDVSYVVVVGDRGVITQARIEREL